MKKEFLFLFLFALAACSEQKTKSDTATGAEGNAAQTAPAGSAANTRYAVNDALFVLAKSGLNLRKDANEKGEKLANIPYGAKVTAVDDAMNNTPYSVEEMPGYKIDGHWVKVNYGGKSGYLFDGYLSKWPAPQKNSDLDAYLDQTCKKVKSDNTLPKKENPEDAQPIEYERIDYADGTQFFHEYYEGGVSHEIHFGKGRITVPEAYLLMKGLTQTAGCKYDAAKKQITCDGEMEMFEVQEKDGQVIVRWSIAD